MNESPKPLANLTGAGIAAGVSCLLYLLTTTIGAKLSHSPIPSEGIAARLTIVVRTALLSVGTGATMIFAVVALGLVLLTIKQVVQHQNNDLIVPKEDNSD